MERRSSAVRQELKPGAAKPWRHEVRRSRFTAALTTMAVMLAAAVTSGPASAHPHVLVTMKSELLYAPDGSVTGIRQAWAFDENYSAQAILGQEVRKDSYTREELVGFAAENAEGLKELDYFTYAKFDGRKVVFGDPVDYWAEYKDSILTLHFTLPVKAPVKAREIELEIYDPTYFVDFGFAKTDPLVLKAAPANCQLTVKKATDDEASARFQSLGEAAFASGDNSGYGAMFANKVWVKCP